MSGLISASTSQVSDFDVSAAAKNPASAAAGVKVEGGCEVPAKDHHTAARATSRIIATAMGRVVVNPMMASCAPHTFLAPRLDNIPDELRVLARFLLWRAEGPAGKKLRKVPYISTMQDSRGSSTDPYTWSTFDQTVAAHDEGGYTGIGFALNNDGLVGIDIDHCVHKGVIEAAALALLDDLGAAYVELSPSATGLRAFGYSDVLSSGRSGMYNGLHVELYSTGRFLTLTGAAIKNGLLAPLRGFVDLANRIGADHKLNPETGELELVPQDARHAELLRRVVTGEDYHASLRDLAASFAGSGMAGGASVNHLRGLMDTSSGPHDDRWTDRRASIPSLVGSAMEKFAPSVVDISAIVRAPPSRVMTVTPNYALPRTTQHVPPHLLSVPGKLGLMVDWTNATASKPQPHFAVQAAIAFGSVVLGRKYCTTQRNWSNLYFLNIGVTGCGKEHAKTVIEECLRAADLGQLIGAGDYTSDAAVHSMLLQKPTHLSVLDEFGMLMESAKSKGNHIGASVHKALMEIFGRAHSTLQPKAYSTAGLSQKQRDELGTREVVNPSLTLLAMTTPGTFFNAVGSGSMQDGFLNRFIVVNTDLGRQLSQDSDYVPPPLELTEWAKTRRIRGVGNMAELSIDVLHSERPEPTVVPFDGDAKQMFADLEKRCMTRMDELEQDGIADMYSRVREIAMKLSLIVSQSCGCATITAAHAGWAIDYVTYWADRSLADLADHIADTPFGALCNEVAGLGRTA